MQIVLKQLYRKMVMFILYSGLIVAFSRLQLGDNIVTFYN